MDIFIALLPALFWGSVVLINVFIGGGPYNQIRGTTFGALIIGAILLISGHASFNPTVIIVGLVSGAFWSLGQGNQLKSIQLIGVSKTMPISTGMQLVGTTLFSAIFLGEWSNSYQILLGLIAMILLILGITLTSLKNKNEKSGTGLVSAIPILLLSTLGYLVYVVIAQIFNVNGLDALFFQSIGMAIGGIILSMKHETSSKYTLLNLIPGVVWAVGNLFLFYSQPKVGVATSFSLSQLLVIVSTLGGVFLLKEKKSHRQMVGISLGIIFIVIASYILGSLKA